MRRFIMLMVIVIVLGSALYVTRSIVQLFAIPETIAFNETTARAAARAFVLEALAEPHSASFGPPDELVVEELGDGVFSCSGWLDAKTDHGDGLRARFTCRMRGTETGAWELVEPVSITEPADARGSIVRRDG